jgi:hypothetical protein
MPAVPRRAAAAAVRKPKQRRSELIGVSHREPNVALRRECHRRPREIERRIRTDNDDVIEAAARRIAREIGCAAIGLWN